MKGSHKQVNINGKDLFWDMTTEAYRVKLWYDVGTGARDLLRVSGELAPGLIEFCIIAPIWLAIMAVMLPWRLVKGTIFVYRWFYHIPTRKLRKKANKELAEKRKIADQRRAAYVGHQGTDFSWDKFLSSFE